MKKKLKLYNTLTKKKSVFLPIDEKNVRVYACGPTVYNFAHIGNGRMAVVCDLLITILRLIYDKVTYVSNITDIDDKIIKAAKVNNDSVINITQKFLEIYNSDMDSLGVTRPDLQPKATEYINEMVSIIEKLIKNKSAYIKENHVLFHVPSYPFYGKLSKRTKEEQIAGSRVEVAPFKKYAGDFVLWKPSKPEEPGWDSPWGLGRPGWHLECSAMSERCLGLPFDIHAGGVDLTFPHHENEIAQSCSIHGNTSPDHFARYWFHNGFVMSNGEKMSKSIGNIKLVNDLIKSFSGETIRLAILSSHYRKPLNWTDKILKQSEKNIVKFYNVLNDLEHIECKDVSINKISSELLEALLDDLNTPKALAYLSKNIKNLSTKTIIEKKKIKIEILSVGKVLGLFQKNPKKILGYEVDDNLSVVINKMVEERKIARSKKDFIKSDKIRKKLKEMGVELEDTQSGTVWRKN